jgi:hypothetical protein
LVEMVDDMVLDQQQQFAVAVARELIETHRPEEDE